MATMNFFILIAVCSPFVTTERVCPGLGSQELSRHEQLDQSNIDEFKNCTVINGNLIINTATFRGDRYKGIIGIHPFQLEVLSSVQNITGFLAVLDSGFLQESLSIFSDLEVIEGRTLYHSGYSLVIKDTALTSLGFKSLTNIANGNVYIRRNPALCYVKKDMFKNTDLFSNRNQQTAYVLRNRPKDLCRIENHVCDNQCSNLGCWGPGVDQCATCKNYYLDGECVDSCNSDSGLIVLSEENKECGHDEDFIGMPEVGGGARTWNCESGELTDCLSECQESLQQHTDINVQLQAEVDELRRQLRDIQKARLRTIFTQATTTTYFDDLDDPIIDP